MAGGRPSKYKPEMCDTLIELMREGKSITAVAAELGITRETVYAWAKENSVFSDALKKGRELCEKHWEEIGHNAALGKVPNFNATAWIFSMKNRFGWKDKQEHEHTGGVTVNIKRFGRADGNKPSP